MKLTNILLTSIIAVGGSAAGLSIAPVANAGPANVSTSCTPIGGGWAQCTTVMCASDPNGGTFCYVLDSWQARIGEAIVHQ